ARDMYDSAPTSRVGPRIFGRMREPCIVLHGDNRAVEKYMGLFALEHGNAAYRADFALYATAVAALATFLFAAGPHTLRLESLALVGVGLVTWTAIEYLLHRFVLHGVAPFKDWHEEHHQRPTALICAPTILSASLILVLV